MMTDQALWQMRLQNSGLRTLPELMRKEGFTKGTVDTYAQPGNCQLLGGEMTKSKILTHEMKAEKGPMLRLFGIGFGCERH